MKMRRCIHPSSTLLDSILSRRVNIDERALHHCLGWSGTNASHDICVGSASAISERAPDAPDTQVVGPVHGAALL